MDFLDKRCLSNSRITGHHNHAGCIIADALEVFQKQFFLLLAAIKFLRDIEPVRDILTSQREIGDLSLHVQLPQTFVEIVFQPPAALIAVFRGLGQQLHHDGRYHFRNECVDLVRGNRQPGKMTVDDFEGIRPREGKRSGQEFIEGCAERIEIRAKIDGSVQPSRLFG